MPQTLLEKIISRCEPDENGCWVWIGAKSNGYGMVRAQEGKARGVHRVVYELVVGPIPKGKQLDHLCRNRACCFPPHLEPVSPRENVLRGVGPAAKQAAQTHCQRGHRFTDATTYRPPSNPNRRVCRLCYMEDYAAKRKSPQPYIPRV